MLPIKLEFRISNPLIYAESPILLMLSMSAITHPLIVTTLGCNISYSMSLSFGATTGCWWSKYDPCQTCVNLSLYVNGYLASGNEVHARCSGGGMTAQKSIYIDRPQAILKMDTAYRINVDTSKVTLQVGLAYGLNIRGVTYLRSNENILIRNTITGAANTSDLGW